MSFCYYGGICIHTIGIYAITNMQTGKKYIGQSKNVQRRWHEHLKYLRDGRHVNRHLQASFQKYGEGAFEFSVIEECDPILLDEREQYWIEQYQTFGDHGYNLTPGGNGPSEWNSTPRGWDYKHSRQIICLNTMTIYKSVADAARKIGLHDTQIGGCCRGTYTYCVKDGIRLVWMYYDVFLDEYASHNYEQTYIDGIIDSAARFSPSYKTRPVVCLNTKEYFESLSDASRASGVAISGIQSCAAHRTNYAGIDSDGSPIVWVYGDEFEKLTSDNISSMLVNASNARSSAIREVRAHRVVCLNTGMIFESVSDAAAFYNVLQSTISSCCTGAVFSAGKFNGEPLVWRYAEDYVKISESEISECLLRPNAMKHVPRNCKHVVCVNDNIEFNTVKEAAAFYHIKYPSQISAAIRHGTGIAGVHPKTGAKLQWSYS